MSRMANLPPWYRAVLPMVLGLWVLVSAYYWLGASGVQASGASVSFDREHDFVLLRIDDKWAFKPDKYGVNVVKYERGPFPLCPLCGVYEPAGTVMNLAAFKKGDWVYVDMTQPFMEAVNLKTGETIDVPAEGELKEPSAAFVAKGLTFDPELKVDRQALLTGLTPLSTINESCVVFNLAFLVLVVPLLVFGALKLLRRPAAA